MVRRALVVAVGLALAVPALALRYRYVELPDRLPFISYAAALNDTGWVVGEARGPYVWTEQSGLWHLGPRFNAGDYAGVSRGVNNHGVVVGDATLFYPGGGIRTMQPFVWTRTGGLRRVPTGNGPGELRAINDAGMAVGVHQGKNPSSAFAYYLAEDRVVLMDKLDPRGSAVAYDVNESGVAVGTGTVFDQNNFYYARPFRWTRSGGVEAVPIPDGAYWVVAYGINGHGDVVMNALFPQGSGQAVYVQKPGQPPQFIGIGEGKAINDDGLLVGYFASGGELAGFVYEPGVGMTELNLITEGLPKGWIVGSPLDINGRGDIAVRVRPPGGQSRGALLVRID
jgi:hypothetical protein